jgi:hypothetical protein
MQPAQLVPGLQSTYCETASVKNSGKKLSNIFELVSNNGLERRANEMQVTEMARHPQERSALFAAKETTFIGAQKKIAGQEVIDKIERLIHVITSMSKYG